MFKKYFTLIIMLAGFAPTSGYGGAQGNSHQLSTAQYVYLKSIADKVELTLQANVVHLEFLRKCLRGYTNPNCSGELNIVRNNIKMKFPNLKRDIFLMAMIQKADVLVAQYLADAKSGKETLIPAHELLPEFESPLAGIENLGDLPGYRFSYDEVSQFTSDDSGFLNWRNVETDSQFQDLQDLSKGKILGTYKLEINDLLKFYCEIPYKQKENNFLHKSNKYGRADPALWNPILKSYKSVPQVCSQMKLVYVPNKKSFKFIFAKTFQNADKWYLDILSKPSFPLSMLGSRAPLQAYRNYQQISDMIQERYIKSLTSMPYIALVRSVNPSASELDNVFNIMLNGAQQELKTLKISKAQAFPKIKNQRASIKKAVQFLAFTPIADDLLKYPTERMDLMLDTNFENTRAGLEEDLSGYESMDLLLELGGAIAITGACFVPVGKLIKAPQWAMILIRGRKLNLGTILCIPGTSLAVNWYFLNEAQSEYDKIYRRVFSTMAGETLLAELDGLKQAEANVVLEQIMFPIGVVSLSLIKNAGVRLTKGSWTYLSKVLN